MAKNIYDNKENSLNNINFIQIEEVVDEMIACQNILMENFKLNYDDIQGGKLFFETNIINRAIKNAKNRKDDDMEAVYNNNLQNEKKYFDIKDYEVSCIKFLENNENLLNRIQKNFSNVSKD